MLVPKDLLYLNYALNNVANSKHKMNVLYEALSPSGAHLGSLALLHCNHSGIGRLNLPSPCEIQTPKVDPARLLSITD